jgi:EAL domain-containing protein (putative c-di-GMP-specific phosphodiesterase class I)
MTAQALLMSLDDIGQGIVLDQFVPYFQPKVAIATRQLVGTEALIRWRHPQRGVILPAAFIPVAESHPVMRDLTDTMLEKSLAQARIWLEQGWPLSVSINFSADVLADIGAADYIDARAIAHGVDAANVVVEIAESVIATHAEDIWETLMRLRAKGFELSIDDYGSGHATPQQLSGIPFTELKIDRSCVHGAHDNAHLRARLVEILELARKLELKSAAIGVETQEDWELLKDLGCDTAQGYLVAKPLPAAEIQNWYGEWTA